MEVKGGKTLRPKVMAGERIRYTIKELPKELRPRERLAEYGEAALSDAELLAIILRTGTAEATALELAHQLLSKFGGLQGLYRCALAELAQGEGSRVGEGVSTESRFGIGAPHF
jgi:DNA repair protein RadC